MMVTGPLVEARLCLATEPEDDCGLAHALEHLIFQVLFSYASSSRLYRWVKVSKS